MYAPHAHHGFHACPLVRHRAPAGGALAAEPYVMTYHVICCCCCDPQQGALPMQMMEQGEITSAVQWPLQDEHPRRVQNCVVTTAYFQDVGLVWDTNKVDRVLSVAECVELPPNDEAHQLLLLGLPTSFGAVGKAKNGKARVQTNVHQVSGSAREHWPTARTELQESIGTEQSRPVWQQALDPSTGCFYYYCEEFQVTQWDPPDDRFLPAPGFGPDAAQQQVQVDQLREPCHARAGVAPSSGPAVDLAAPAQQECQPKAARPQAEPRPRTETTGMLPYNLLPAGLHTRFPDEPAEQCEASTSSTPTASTAGSPRNGTTETSQLPSHQQQGPISGDASGLHPTAQHSNGQPQPLLQGRNAGPGPVLLDAQAAAAALVADTLQHTVRSGTSRSIPIPVGQEAAALSTDLHESHLHRDLKDQAAQDMWCSSPPSAGPGAACSARLKLVSLNPVDSAVVATAAPSSALRVAIEPPDAAVDAAASRVASSLASAGLLQPALHAKVWPHAEGSIKHGSRVSERHANGGPRDPSGVAGGRAQCSTWQAAAVQQAEHVATSAGELPRRLKKYWLQRYSLFERYDEGVLLDEEGWYSATPEAIARHHASVCACGVIVDAFAGVGGNAIQFGMTCRRVIAVDTCQERLMLARHNAQVYGVADRIDFVCADFFVVAPRLKADVVFLSPPWGGPAYGLAESYDPDAALVPLNTTLKGLLAAAASAVDPTSRRGGVACFLPRNTDLRRVSEALEGAECQVERAVINGKVLKAVTVYIGGIVQPQVQGFPQRHRLLQSQASK